MQTENNPVIEPEILGSDFKLPPEVNQEATEEPRFGPRGNRTREIPRQETPRGPRPSLRERASQEFPAVKPMTRLTSPVMFFIRDLADAIDPIIPRIASRYAVKIGYNEHPESGEITQFQIELMDKNRRFELNYTPPLSAEAIARDLARFVEE